MSINVNVDEVVSFTYHNKVRIGWVDFSNDDYLKVTEINLNHTKCFNWAQVSEFRSFGVDAVICEVSGENVKLEVIDDHHIISYLPEKVIKVDDNFIIKNGYGIIDGVNVGLVPQAVLDWAASRVKND
jgi:hypothetical protein